MNDEHDYTIDDDMEYNDLLAREEREKQLESVANLCHEQWAGWMNYMFLKAKVSADGTWTMPFEYVDRWQRQMNTPYFMLSEAEQNSDRTEARKFLELILGDKA